MNKPPRDRLDRPVSGLLRRLLIGVFAGPLVLTAIADGQEIAAGAISFDIPSEPLAPALDAYSVVTGMSAVYNGNLVIGRRSGEVKGRFTPAAALDLLLNGSGLAAAFTGPYAFVLLAAPAQAAMEQTPSAISEAALARQDAMEQSYSGLLQSKIKALLCASPRTRPGSYRLAMRFVIGPAGTLAGLKLLSGTGDQQRDAALVDNLNGLQIGVAPPVYMPQPFVMVMLPKSSGGAADCPAPAGSP